MSDQDAHKTAPNQAPTDPSTADDLRIDSPSTGTHSTDLHNLRGDYTSGQDVPGWVEEATRGPGAAQPRSSQPGVNLGNPYGPAQASSSPLPLSTMSEIGTKKLVAGLLAIFLGSFGAHKFYLGRTGPGLVMLLVNLGGWFLTTLITLVTFGIAGILFIPLMSLVAAALGIVGLIEGIVYLTRSDDDFSQTYLVNRKDWF